MIHKIIEKFINSVVLTDRTSSRNLKKLNAWVARAGTRPMGNGDYFKPTAPTWGV